ncbi:hypothetical protein [Mycobacterium sp.]|uniref:hypothetical protein n=1 Tax=Mycobacterium sp. TaxID=1785 RepID=UPI003BAD133B
MTVFGRFTIKVVASAGLCGAAIALSPGAEASPLKTGGAACLQGMSDEVAAPAAAAPAAAGGVCAAGAPVTDMAGVPLVAPGALPVVPAGAPLIAFGPPVPPIPVAPPVVPPIPVTPPVPPIPVAPPIPPPVPIPPGAPLIALGPVAAGAPVAAPAPVGAPIVGLAGTFGGKGDPISPPPEGGPTPAQPTMPGPSATDGG